MKSILNLIIFLGIIYIIVIICNNLKSKDKKPTCNTQLRLLQLKVKLHLLVNCLLYI